VAGLALLAGLTIGALIGLNAECNGAGCPRSDAFRVGLFAIPMSAGLLLVAGAAWTLRRRSVRPLVLAEAAAIAIAALIDAVLYGADVGTVVLFGVAALVGYAALRRRA